MIRTPDFEEGLYERAFARLDNQVTLKEKVDAEVEVELLKVQARLCEKDLAIKYASAIEDVIANKGAKIANLMSIMEAGMLAEAQMVEARNKLFELGTDNS